MLHGRTRKNTTHANVQTSTKVNFHEFKQDIDFDGNPCFSVPATHIFTIFSPLSKNESKLMKSPVCLSMCPPLITFELPGRSS
jgi:hypothetical protein